MRLGSQSQDFSIRACPMAAAVSGSVAMSASHSQETEFASVLHNTRQSRLSADAIQSETAALEGDTDRAKDALRYAHEALDQSGPDPITGPGLVVDRLGEGVTAWLGIVQIDVFSPSDLSMSASAKFAIDAAGVRCQCGASRPPIPTRTLWSCGWQPANEMCLQPIPRLTDHPTKFIIMG